MVLNSNRQLEIKDGGITNSKIKNDEITSGKLNLGLSSKYAGVGTINRNIGTHKICFLQGINDATWANPGRCSVFPESPGGSFADSISDYNFNYENKVWYMTALGAKCRALCID